jgi:hypothetical protein
MQRSRLQNVLTVTLLVSIVLAVAIAMTTNDPILKASIQSTLVSETLKFKLKSLPIILAIVVAYVIVSELAPNRTIRLKNFATYLANSTQQKMNTKQTVAVTIWMATFLFIALSFQPNISAWLGWFLALCWFALLLLPLHLLRSDDSRSRLSPPPPNSAEPFKDIPRGPTA